MSTRYPGKLRTPILVKKPKRMNDKRKCGFCKITFPSQRTYNDHVNNCKENR